MFFSLPQRIREIREAAGDSPQKAADKLQISRQAFMKWENGAAENMKIGNLLNFCDKYNISLEVLLRGAMSRNEPYALAPPGRGFDANEETPEEHELIIGYRHASSEVQEIMLEVARKATKKHLFPRRSETQ